MFFRFATISWAVENLVFHVRVVAFKTLPQEQLAEEAKKIFHEFIAVDSFYQINVDMPVRESLFEKINEGKVDPDMFHEAEAHALSLLRYSVFPLWKASAEFKEILRKARIRDITEMAQMHSTKAKDLL